MRAPPRPGRRDVFAVPTSGNDERMAHWRAGHAGIRASRRFWEACLTCGGILAPHSRSMCVRSSDRSPTPSPGAESGARVCTGRCITCNRPREVERLSQCASCRATHRAREARKADVNLPVGCPHARVRPSDGRRHKVKSVRRALVPYRGAEPVLAQNS